MKSVLLVLAMLSLSVTWGQNWVDLGAHTHLDFSDGTLSMDGVLGQFYLTGHQFVVLADHAEMINMTPDQRKLYQKTYQKEKEVGVDNWVAQVATQDNVIPGLECGLGAGRGSHLLFYGGRLADYPDVVSVVEEAGEDNPLDAMRWLRGYADANSEEVDTVLIVAHPFCSLYPFTQPVYDLVDGVEVFDGISSDPVEELKLIAMMKRAYERPLTVVTGSDFHGAGISRMSEALGGAVQDPYEPCLERHTLVCANGRDDIPGALKRAECYAAFKRARISSATAWPGGKQDPSSVFKVVCSGMDKKLGNKVFVLLVGRSGQSMSADAPLEWKGGTASLSLDLKGAPSDVIKDGAFLYLLIAGQLATSGIEVLPYDNPNRVVENSEPEPGDSGGGLDLGGLDLGKVGNVLAGALLQGFKTGSNPKTIGKALLAALEWALVDRGVITGGGPDSGGSSGSAQGSQGGLQIPTTNGGGGGSAQGPTGNLGVLTTR